MNCAIRLGITVIVAFGIVPASGPTAAAAQPFPYFPRPGAGWERRSPSAVGMDAALVAQALEFARSQETDFPRDFSAQARIFGRPLGPLPAQRAATNGLIIRHGYIVAEWGDTTHVDPTYSAAKSFLSTVLGLALDRRLIKDIDVAVGRSVHDGGYDSLHNRKVTWRQHAQQTSEWEGEMWGKSHDFIGVREFGEGTRPARALVEPGTHYEYNDVRINRFALSLLRVWKQPLPDVLKDAIMDPIGASSSWRWVPYDNARAEVEGKMMPSVSGGTRWGGGLWISAQDEARFGLLFLNKGKWHGSQIVSEAWVKTATTPSKENPTYGCLWWLNTDAKLWPGMPASSFAAVGFGGNTVWIDPDDDIVVVWRWHKGNGADLFRKVIESVRADR
jgi:CubicO group peptidase (beta-lactamase class C family)